MSLPLYQKMGFQPCVRSTTRVGFMVNVLICIKCICVFGLRSGSRSPSAVNRLARHWTTKGSEFWSIPDLVKKPIYTHGAEDRFQLSIFITWLLLLLLWFSTYTYPNAVHCSNHCKWRCTHLQHKYFNTIIHHVPVFNINILIYLYKQCLYSKAIFIFLTVNELYQFTPFYSTWVFKWPSWINHIMYTVNYIRLILLQPDIIVHLYLYH